MFVLKYITNKVKRLSSNPILFITQRPPPQPSNFLVFFLLIRKKTFRIFCFVLFNNICCMSPTMFTDEIKIIIITIIDPKCIKLRTCELDRICYGQILITKRYDRLFVKRERCLSTKRINFVINQGLDSACNMSCAYDMMFGLCACRD